MTSLSEGPGTNALLSFTAENARSYRDEVQLSMLGTRLSAEGVPRSLVPTGMTKPIRVLPAAGIFGANASGKTTILRTIVDMRGLVLMSFRHGSRRTPVPRRPFLLDPEYRDRPTRFEIHLVLDGVRWVYGFKLATTGCSKSTRTTGHTAGKQWSFTEMPVRFDMAHPSGPWDEF